MRRILYSIAVFGILLISQIAKAQQDPMYTQYMFNPLTVNAAYAGSKDYMNFIYLSRYQWVGFEGAPKTHIFTLHAPVKKEKLGLGFSFIRDNIGPLTVNNLYIDVAYRIKVHEGGFLSMGIKAGMDIRKNNLTKLNALDPTDAVYAKDVVSKINPNFGAGLFYYTQKYYVGLSTPKISSTDLSTDNSAVLEKESLSRHYFLIGGYVWDLNENVKFKPATLLKWVKGAPVSVDLTANFMMKEKFIAGLAFRFGDSFGALIQYRPWDRIWIGYAYDLSISKIRKYNGGSHEIMINYDMALPKNDVIKSPRFF